MLKFIIGLIASILGLWERLDEETKKNIVEGVVRSFEILFREFYRNYKKIRKT